MGKCMRLRACGCAFRSRACDLARVALLISMPSACAIFSAVSVPPPYFSTVSHKRPGFRENVTERKMCVLIFSTKLI